MKPACARAWQAEAVEDGRLSRADRASFERHVAVCSACAREVHALHRLREMGRGLSGPLRSPLERRRLRSEILRRANGRVVRDAPAGTWLVRSAIAGVLLATATLALWLRVSPPVVSKLDGRAVPTLSRAVRARVPGAAPTFELETSPDAAWHTVEQSSTLRLALGQGRFSLAVHELRGGQRFVLDLPDGELEVHGTRFVVQIADRRTRAVHVSEGRVAVRIRDRAPFTLGAGQAWSLSGPPAEDGVATRSPSPTPVAAATSALRSTASDAGAQAAPAADASTEPRAGEAFSRAMAAFSAGNFAHAEHLLTRFEREHPGDARVEDATFLRAVARARRGDAAAARLLARDYLRRYPRGLRRLEAERLAR